MEAATIEMDRDQAAEKAEAFKRLPELTPEDEATMKGYEALAKGKALIDLVKTMREAGLNEQGLPRLAIARADERAITFERSTRWDGRSQNSIPDGGGRFTPDVYIYGSRQIRTRTCQVPPGTFDETKVRSSAYAPRRVVAHLPTIPPEHRPRSSLANYHVLWEAEWKPVAPVDPMLLKHLSGALYVVLAEWDLTPLEQAVLQGQITMAAGR